MPNILSLINHKGGVAKTTSVYNIGHFLAHKGYRVLLIDIDAQANLTLGFKIDINSKTLMKMIRDEYVEILPIRKNLDLIPSALDLLDFDSYKDKPQSDYIFRYIFADWIGKYDYVLFDCPPNLGLTTRNALAMSDFILIPLQAEFYPMNGIDSLINEVQRIRKISRSQLKILGMFLTFYDRRLNLHTDVEQTLRKRHKEFLFVNHIRKNIALSESPLMNKSIFEYEPDSNGSHDYKMLCKEIILKINDSIKERGKK